MSAIIKQEMQSPSQGPSTPPQLAETQNSQQTEAVQQQFAHLTQSFENLEEMRRYGILPENLEKFSLISTEDLPRLPEETKKKLLKTGKSLLRVSKHLSNINKKHYNIFNSAFIRLASQKNKEKKYINIIDNMLETLPLEIRQSLNTILIL